MHRDPFSDCHPAVNFLYFVCVIGFGVVIQHPAYAAASCICGVVYYLLLSGKKGFRLILGLIPVFILVSVLNPLINTSGKMVLFRLFGRKYTFEALCYGMAIGAMFVVMMVWFGCYSAVLTSDKFTSLFGNLIPALSLLLVMVLRMIPAFTRKAKQITGARDSIGKGTSETASTKEIVTDGISILSALTDWALEGSIVTADSMQARGYGSGKRTHFQIYRMTLRDWILIVLTLFLSACVLHFGGTGARFTPRLKIPALTWGFAAYCILLLIPTILSIKEAILWHSLRSKI